MEFWRVGIDGGYGFAGDITMMIPRLNEPASFLISFSALPHSVIVQQLEADSR